MEQTVETEIQNLGAATKWSTLSDTSVTSQIDKAGPSSTHVNITSTHNTSSFNLNNIQNQSLSLDNDIIPGTIITRNKWYYAKQYHYNVLYNNWCNHMMCIKVIDTLVVNYPVYFAMCYNVKYAGTSVIL